MQEQIKTVIGETGDTFISTIRIINGSTYLLIPNPVAIVGSYLDKEVVKVHIKKVVKNWNMTLIKAKHKRSGRVIIFTWYVSIEQAKKFNPHFIDWEYI